MSASARFAVYDSTTGEIVRAGRCAVGQELIQAIFSNEVALNETAVNFGIVGTIYEHVSDVTHYVDVPAGNVLTTRFPIVPTFSRLTVVANSVDTVTCSSLPTVGTHGAGTPAISVRVVGPGVDTTVSTTSGSVALTFDTPGNYTLTFSGYPKFIPKDQAIIASAYANVTGVSSTGSAGTVWAAGSSFATPVTGVSSTTSLGAVWAAGSSFGAPVTGVNATGSVGTVSKSISKTPTGVSGTVSVGAVGKSNSHPMTGVSLTGVAADAIPTSITAAVIGDYSTGAVSMPSTEFGANLPSVSTTVTLGAVSFSIAPNVTSVTVTGVGGQIGADLAVAVTGVSTTGVTDGL